MADNEYPFYPTLPDAAKEEAQELINQFKEELIKIAEETIGDLYTYVMVHIESDSWTNFRNELMQGFKGYNVRAESYYDFKEIRKQIYEEYRDEIIKDLDQDNLNRIESLEKEMERLINIKRDCPF